ncbi:MAG: CHASE domain-containing protein [Prochlorococcaceae cyanobacterium]
MASGEPGRTLPWPGTKPLNACLQMAALYLLVGAVSFVQPKAAVWADPVWPAAGIALGMLLSDQPGRREGIALGSFLLSLPVLLRTLPVPGSMVAAAGISLAATLQAQVSAHLVRQRLGPRPPLQRSGEILRFMALAGPVACLIGASMGVATLRAAGLIAPADVSRTWISWWAGDAIGVIVFAPLTLMALPSQSDLWQGRRRIVALPSLLVLAVALAAFLHASSIERREALLRMDQRADLAVENLRRTLTAHQEALYGLQSLIRATGEPSPEEFSSYTSSNLKRLQGLHALSWNPLVPDQDRNAFEARQRRMPGRHGFRITERDRGGALIPAQRRPTSVPVTLIEPLNANQAALGFDIGSDPIRAETIRAAEAAGSPQATAPIQLVQEQGLQKGVLMILPIKEPRGFVVGVYRLEDLLEDCFSDPGWRGFQMRLLETRAGHESRELARVPGDADVIEPSQGSAAPIVRRPVEVGGQPWLLEVKQTAPFPGYGPGRASSLFPLLVLLVIAPLESFLLLTSGTERLRQRRLQQKLRTSLTAAAKAHEIKQPLARLLLQASSIQRLRQRQRQAAPDDGAFEGLAEGIARDARQVSGAIDSIRNLLENGDHALAPIDVSEPVEAALLVLKGELEERRIQMATRGLHQPHQIEGDRGQLQVMVINLVRNAIAAAGPGGRIEITLSDRPFGVELNVEDDGPGFPKGVHQLEDVFLASRRPEGTGIGLFLVSCAVDNHRGSVHLGRSLLGGAGITVRFPPVTSWRRSSQPANGTPWWWPGWFPTATRGRKGKSPK